MVHTLHPGQRAALLTAEAATTGLIFDTLARPVREDEPFWTRRFTNGLCGALTWGTLSAAASGLKYLSIRSNSVSQPWVINSFSRDMQRTALAGGLAGIVDAQAHSLLKGDGFAGLRETAESAYGFATTGMAMVGLSEGTNRLTGKQRLADVVGGDKELQSAVLKDPVAKEILAQRGDIAVRRIVDPDVYKSLEFDFAMEGFDSRAARKLAVKRWKPLEEVVRMDVEGSISLTRAMATFAADRYGAATKAKLIAGGKDSAAILLESGEVLKLSWHKAGPQIEQRSFDAPRAERHSTVLDGHTISGWKQPLANMEVPVRLNEIFRVHSRRMGFHFYDWLAPQLGYANKQLMLVDPFAVNSDLSTFSAYNNPKQIADISRVDAGLKSLTRKK